MNTAERLVKIKEKLETLKNKDKEMKVFGAGDDQFFGTIGHHYEMHPVLSEEEVLQEEKKLGIKLPEEYREFLLKIGNGGAGPEWGLFKLENTHPDDEMLKEYPDFCSMECSYADDYANGIKAHLDKDPTYLEPVEPFGGYLKLADYGHGMCAYMVVGGDQQIGKIWFMLEDGGTMQIAPAYQKVAGRDWQASFLDWYENWLDDSLANL